MRNDSAETSPQRGIAVRVRTARFQLGLSFQLVVDRINRKPEAYGVFKAKKWGKHFACLSIHRVKRKLEAYAAASVPPS